MSTEDEERTEVLPEEAQLVSSEMVGGEEDFNPFDELREDFKPSHLKRVIGADGLPVTMPPTEKSDIPPLSPETLVCMADTRVFVRRDMFGRIASRHDPSAVVQTPDGRYYLKSELPLGQSGMIPPKPVLPIRPACQHYVRQMTSFELNAEHSSVYRLCGGRRTTEGTFMTVRDMKVEACSMREPRDLESEQRLEKFDELKMEQGRNRENFSIFSSKE
jgi:hypothetical protein